MWGVSLHQRKKEKDLCAERDINGQINIRGINEARLGGGDVEILTLKGTGGEAVWK